MAIQHIFRIGFAAFLLCLAPSALLAQSAPQAISGIVSGKVQQVGFRAMILKQAIQYNLAGTAQNLDNGTVKFGLQGDGQRIEKAVAAIRQGTPKSSDVQVATSPAPADANLTTFTVIAWTSTSRHITNPYNLVFTLRADDSIVSEKEAKAVYHNILKSTLNPEDLQKLEGKED